MAGSATSDGRITTLTTLASTLAGTEVMYIVSPGNTQLGVSYQITLDTLGAFFGAYPVLNTEIVTAGSTYDVKTTDTRVLVNKTLGSATTITFPTALSMQYPYGVLVKDLKGDADSNNITINFTGGELCDGQGSGVIVINNPYGWVTITPVPGASAWYMS